METLINKLYQESYESRIRPHDLLQNLKLDNYYRIDFTKSNKFLIATVYCDLHTGESAKFEYKFLGDRLESLTQIKPHTIQNVIYDRESELNRIRDNIKEALQEKVSSTA